MAKILIVSDSPAIQSGLGRVTRELAGRMSADGVDVAVAGWFDIHADIDQAFDFPVYPAMKVPEQSLAPLLETFRPNVVLAIGDPWDFKWLAAQRAKGTSWQLAGYLNIEGAPLPLACERILDGFDVIVTTSEFGAQTIGRPGVHAVHHGVDPMVFRPMGQRVGDFGGHKLVETFFVLLNGQNTVRKNFPVALRGFAKFAQGKSDVLLYANTKAITGPDDSPGPNLLQTVVNLGMADTGQIQFNPENQGPLQTISDVRLNQVYNMATVLLVTSWAEGFGLPVLEAQAVGVVPIAPNAYSMPELIESRGFTYPVAAHLENEVGMCVAVVSEDDVAGALERAYGAWKNTVGWAARRRECQAFASPLTWDKTYEGIKDALETAPLTRTASGGPISPQLRLVGRAAARRHDDAFGVLKLGGLGDLLQTTVVVAAAAKKLGRKAVVFTNQTAPVFEGMAEVAEVVQIAAQPQQVALESLADEFSTFYDLRYVSWVYGSEKPDPYAERHRWFYDDWTRSSSRLHTLGLHSTSIMLRSLGLGLETDSIRPIYSPRRAPAQPLPFPNSPVIAIAGGVGPMGGLKKWPVEAWADLIQKAMAEGFRAVQIGGAEDELLPDAVDLRGLSLAETAWVIDHARAVVAVEGGMAHLAAATDTPAVVIFGPTPVVTFSYPGHKAARAIGCTPCWGAEPMWSAEQCALGQDTCFNFPSPNEVLEQLMEIVRGRH